MGIVMNVLEQGRGVELVVHGVLEGKEIIQGRKIMDVSHVTENFKYYIFNQLQCTELNVTHLDIVSLAALDIKAAKLNSNIMIAIIESAYLQFSLTDLWCAHVENDISNIKSFKDRKAALTWIKKAMQ